MLRSILQMVGQAEVDIASHMATYEITVMQEVVAVLNNMLEVRLVNKQVLFTKGKHFFFCRCDAHMCMSGCVIWYLLISV